MSMECRVSEDGIRKLSKEDSEYTSTIQLIEGGRASQVTGEYRNIANELLVHNNMLLRDGKFVIPKSDGEMRRKLLETAHEGHPGMTHVKTILRGTVYWPGITKHIEEACGSCLACQATKDGSNHRDKLVPNEPPENVWSRVGADHWGYQMEVDVIFWCCRTT